LTGHIEKKKGKFQVVLEYGIDGNGKRIRKYKTFDKESEAKKYLIQMLANEGKFIPLNEFLDRWLEEYAKNYVAPKTYIKYKDSLKHVRKAFPSHTLQQLNTFELQKFFNQLSQTLSQASVRKIYSVLNNALKTAIKWNMLKENPLEFVKLPQKYEEKKIKVWDIETVKKFLEDIKDEKIHTAVTLALHAGLRAGEICGLTWDNVDFEKKCIHIKQALQKIGKEIIIKPPTEATYDPAQNVIVGNTCLYGATGGVLFANGLGGERFAVRNSKGVAVIEGTGDHCCEYMTGGTIVVLGKVGRNVAAGMTGGLAYFLDEDGLFPELVNREIVKIQRVLTTAGEKQLQDLIQAHAERTGSPKAQMILDNWQEYLPKFWQLVPPSEAESPEANPQAVVEKYLSSV